VQVMSGTTRWTKPRLWYISLCCA